jgi:16S rRNA (cytosine1402-N4)-methyltransferase
MKPQHQPVLAAQVVNLLDPKPGEIYFDGTAGYGGHASIIASKVGDGRVILSDRDEAAIHSLQSQFGRRADIWQLPLSEAANKLQAEDIYPDLILLDLGVSSPQLDQAARGFSFQQPGPIDMRMDTSQKLTAAEVVNHYSEAQLAALIGDYGEEHRAKIVARAIVQHRPFANTTELAAIVRKAAGKSSKIDPATRTFQALRMVVNNELGELVTALPILTKQLAPAGRMVIISFHSLEDRIVKQWFDRQSRGCICPPGLPVCSCGHQATVAKLTKKPLSGELDSHNPRARSAKLRAVMKLKHKGG